MGFPRTTAQLFVFMLLTLGSVSFAQDRDRDPVDTSGVIVEGAIGIDDIVDSSDPMPVSFLLTNNSQNIIEATLHLTNPIGKDEIFLGEVTLAPKTTRRFSTLRDLGDWFECYGELRAKGQVIWRRELPVATGNDFNTDDNFVLLIDDSGRRLITQKKAASAAAMVQAAQVYRRSKVAGEDGRDVRSLNMKSWQVPNHPAPLAPIQAIVYPEAIEAKLLNRLQWRCVAEWVCEGGTFYFHSESKDVLETLTKASPLTFEVAGGEETTPVRRMGLGEIREYGQPLFSSKGAATRQEISSQVGMLEGPMVRSLVKDMSVNDPDYQTQVQVNRLYVAGLFGIYTLFIGLFALLMFRFSRRVVAIYTVIVVAAASVAAVTLGGMLRYSRGDLKWASVSYIGAGGLVQFARLNIQSSGGLNEGVAVKGKTPDLQFTGQAFDQRRNYYYYGSYEEADANPPFDLQLNQFGADKEDAFKVKVRMTPWGRRQLHATDYKPGVKGVVAKLDYTQNPSDANLSQPVGQFKLRVENPAGLQVSRAWVSIGVTRYHAYDDNEGMTWDQWGNPAFPNSGLRGDQMLDMYHRESFQMPSSSKPLELEFQTKMRQAGNSWELTNRTDMGSFAFRRISRGATARAWIFMVVNQSPSLQIDEENSEFISHNELHLIVQEIPPENMPDASLFLGVKPPPPQEVMNEYLESMDNNQ